MCLFVYKHIFLEADFVKLSEMLLIFYIRFLWWSRDEGAFRHDIISSFWTSKESGIKMLIRFEDLYISTK